MSGILYVTGTPIGNLSDLSPRAVQTLESSLAENSNATTQQALQALKKSVNSVCGNFCDFYIKSLDLYMECNFHWTHGFHPYNENSIEDVKKLDLWKSKGTNYYFNAINTWTVRDINKRNTAKKNNLNYVELFSLDEAKKFIDNIMNIT